MKKICFTLLFLFVPVISFAQSALNIQHWQTQNGAQVYFVQARELPIVDVRVVFQGGSAFDGKLPGLASLTNVTLADGAGNLSADQIAEQFDDIGAIYMNDVGRTMAVLGFRSLADIKYLYPALKTFGTVLTKPTFPLKQFDREKLTTLGAISKQGQLPGAVAKNTFYRAIYQNNPLAHPTLGNKESVKKITVQDLQRFYHRYYVSKNALIAIVGDISKKQAEKIANETVGLLPQGAPAEKIPTASNLQDAIVENVNFPAEQTNIYLGQIGIARDNPDYFALKVGNYVLGGGMTSLLFEQVRNKRGLAYSVYSAFVPGLVRGPFLINLQSRNDKADEAIKVVKETLGNFVQQGPSDQEVNFAKQYIIQSFPLALSSNSDIISIIMQIGFYHLPLNYLDTYRDNINAVTALQIRQVFQRIIDPNKMALITVGKKVERQNT